MSKIQTVHKTPKTGKARSKPLKVHPANQVVIEDGTSLGLAAAAIDTAATETENMRAAMNELNKAYEKLIATAKESGPDNLKTQNEMIELMDCLGNLGSAGINALVNMSAATREYGVSKGVS